MDTPATILIVDDNALFRETLHGLINIAHPTWRVMEASDGAEGVRIAQANQPNLILLDLNMPVMNGYEAAVQLRAHPSTRHTPLVLMTSEDRDDPLVARLRTICQSFLTKPFSFRELKRIFDRLLHTSSESEGYGQPFPNRPALEPI